MRSLAERLDLLGEGAAHEHDCGSAAGGARRLAGGIYYSHAGGRRVALLKVLQSSVCRNDCLYCAFRSGRDVPRACVAPDEMARHFLDLRRRGVVEGLFLSSGIHGSADSSMERIVATAQLVRRAGFRGYMHLKILPGASDAAVEAAVTLADRVSINLEVPCQSALSQVSEAKRLDNQIMGPLRVAARLASRGAGARSGVTTQFVVGVAGERDAELLDRAASMYDEDLIVRAYYSRFVPPDDGPLAGRPEAPRKRGLRLYQADALLRFYGFARDEIPLDREGMLPLGVDPKSNWAALRPDLFPVEVNTASREDLLRVPGLGPTGVERILAVRRATPLRSEGDLARMGLRAGAAGRYLTFRGRPARRWSQLPLSLGSQVGERRAALDLHPGRAAGSECLAALTRE